MLRTMVRRAIERGSGLHIFKKPPRGTDIFFDIANDLPDLKVRTVFDVGANVGQSAREFLEAFPEATIRCFEPVQSTYETLRGNVAGNPRVLTYRTALGASAHEEAMALHGPSSMFRLASAGSGGEAELDHAPTETVAVDTLDGFCAANGVDHINYLKIDTEGSDLEVLRGAAGLIGRAAIDFIQVEVGMSPRNCWHVPLQTFIDHLGGSGYELYVIAEQHRCYTPPAPYLHRADAVFVSPLLNPAHSGRVYNVSASTGSV